MRYLSKIFVLLTLLANLSITKADQITAYGPGPAASSSSTAWNPSDKTAGATLSTTSVTNDTSTSPNTTTNAFAAVRSTTSYSTGKVFAEFAITGIGDFAVWGFCDGTSNLSAATCGNQDAHGVVLDQNGTVRHNTGAGLVVFGALTGLTKVQFAKDRDANLLWVRWYNGSSWSTWNADGSADPETATNGVTPTVSGALFLYVSNYQDNSTQNIAQIKCSGFSTAIPSGFSAC